MTMEVNTVHFKSMYKSHVIKRKPTSVKTNPLSECYAEWVHKVIVTMLHTAEINKATSAATSDIDVFLTNTTCAIRSTSHTILTASPGTATLKRVMLFNIPCIADWNKIGDLRQNQTDHNTAHEINH